MSEASEFEILLKRPTTPIPTHLQRYQVMSLSYRENYWDSPELKAEFMRFMKQIHGIDLSLWNQMGFWDQKYRPFSYFNGDKLVSHACVYSMDMTVQGKRCQVAQISAVGTIPDYRRKGLSYELNQKAIAWARENHDFFYLFADEEAVKLYEKCGFRAVDQYKPRISVDGTRAKPGAVKLDIQNKDDLALIYRIASARAPVSDVLGVSNEKLFMFWCLSFLRENIYYISELDVLVLYKCVGGVVTIFDIVGRNIPLFSE
ncbi:MAG: GNAT family N-acetyltransferase, partial [candidate division Zixibacteria bacterium]|nr:GNAT family N-acetyltransferase [candidate division Zixibacteria bacterium]